MGGASHRRHYQFPQTEQNQMNPTSEAYLYYTTMYVCVRKKVFPKKENTKTQLPTIPRGGGIEGSKIKLSIPLLPSQQKNP